MRVNLHMKQWRALNLSFVPEIPLKQKSEGIKFHIKTFIIPKNTVLIGVIMSIMSLQINLCFVCFIYRLHLHHARLNALLPCNSVPAVKVILMALPTGMLSLSLILTGLLHTCDDSVSPGPAGLGGSWTDWGPAGQGWRAHSQVRYQEGVRSLGLEGSPEKAWMEEGGSKNSTNMFGVWTVVTRIQSGLN